MELTPGLLKAHVIFMVLAFLLFLPLGVMLNSYLRHRYQGSVQEVWGKPTWFQAHRLFLMFTVIFALTGIACVFAYLGRYASLTVVSSVATAHPIIGLLVASLLVANAIFAAFRPPEEHSVRACFRAAHVTMGSLITILAVINIFIGMSFAFYTQTWWWWVFGVQVVFGVILEIALCAIPSAKTEGAEADDKTPLFSAGTRTSNMLFCCIVVYLSYCAVSSLAIVISVATY